MGVKSQEKPTSKWNETHSPSKRDIKKAMRRNNRSIRPRVNDCFRLKGGVGL